MFKKYFFIVFIFLVFISVFFSQQSDNNLYFPVRKKNYYISSYFEYRTLKYYHFHNGIDVPLVPGTPLYPLSFGVVSFIGYNGGYGNSIIITYHNGYKSLYGHISSDFLVKIGQSVSPNDIIAYVGPKYLKNGKLNGFTTGPHLHYTLYYQDKLINPLSVNYST